MKKDKALELLNDFPSITPILEKQMRNQLEQYLIVDKTKAFCTACESIVYIDSNAFDEVLGHRETVTCPCCGRKVTCILNYHNFCGSVVEDSANAVVFLSVPDNDNLYLSCFTVKVFFRQRSLKPEYEITEFQRYVFTDKTAVRYGRNRHYEYRPGEWGEFGYYERVIEDEWIPRARFTEPQFLATRYYYPINMQAIKDTCLRYSEAEHYPGRMLVTYLKFYQTHRGAERLIKSQLGDIVRQAVELPHLDNSINWDENEVHKMLGVPADVCRAIRDERILLRDYKTVSKHFPNTPIDKLVAYNRVINWQYGSLERASRITAMKDTEILKYLIKQSIRLNDYMDYLEVAQYIGYDLINDRSVRLPHNFWAAHDRAVEARCLIIEEREREKQRAYQQSFDKLKKERRRLEFVYGEYTIIQPQKLSDIIDEGKTLSHCVGGYAQRHAEGKLSIMFLRKISAPDKPYYTIEVNKAFQIVQCRGYKNDVVASGGKEKPREIIEMEKAYQAYLDTLAAKKAKKVRKSA